MDKLSLICGGSAIAVAALLVSYSEAGAQAKAPSEATEVAQVVVTGSLIQGTPTNTAIPVSVISEQELQKKGSPSVVELVKELPIAVGAIGDANQFSAGKGQRAEGFGSINLRGLGPERTLVLLNGHRLPLEHFPAKWIPVRPKKMLQIYRVLSKVRSNLIGFCSGGRDDCGHAEDAVFSARAR